MKQNPIDIKADKKVFKAASLMGSSNSGPPSVVESGADGRITRIRPLYYEDYVDWDSLNPWSIKARGSSFSPPRRSVPGVYYMTYKKRVYSENRVRWPLKRVDWDPKGERNTHNRGKSRYVRISWDEAAQIVADELLRIRDKYGMSAVLAEADMHGEGKHLAPCHGCMNKLLSILGGYTVQMRNMDSWEGWYWGSRNVWGGEPVGEMKPAVNVWEDIIKNSEQILFWASDPETTPVGFDGYMASRLSQWIHTLGIKYVYVDPALNFSGCYLADKWIPVLPNTDAALYLGVIYTWLAEGTYDREYVATHATGFDEFFDYVLGRADGEPKTPAWAAEKCGVPEWTIKALARAWAAKVTSITIGNGGPGIRGPFSSEPARLQSIALSMQGLGKPGRHQAKWLEWDLYENAYTLPYQGRSFIQLPSRCELVRPPMSDVDSTARNPHDITATAIGRIDEVLAEKYKDDPETFREKHDEAAAFINEAEALTSMEKQAPQQAVPKCMVHDAILKGHVEWWGLHSFCGQSDEQWEKNEFPAPGCSTLHMMWTDSPCMVTCWNDGFNFVKAVRSPEIECIVAQHPWLENDCYLADIILPVATRFEIDEISDDRGSGIVTSVYRERTACPPVGESVDDFSCVARIAGKISDEVYRAYTYNDTATERLIELFWRSSHVSHLDVNDDFHRKDIFVMPVDEAVRDIPVGLSEFVENPEEHPLSTPTGKLEFTSTKILENFPDDSERPPYPKWIEKSELHDERLSSERAKKYPLLCMSNHGRWRFHANCDDITWNREVPTMKLRGRDGYQYEPAWMNPITAAERGIEFGDIIKVYNERGTILCAAYVTERLVPGAVYVDHGSRFDPVDAEALDRGGAINLISPHSITSAKATGMVVSGFLVDVRKVTDAEMDDWRKKFPESFARKIDEATGVCLDGWLLNN